MSVAVTGAALSLTASPAAAEVPANAGNWVLANYSTEDGVARCLDDSVIALRAIGCNDLNYQIWETGRFADGTYEFLNHQTGKCLDDSPNLHLRTERCNGGWGGYQRWRSVRTNELMNVATGLCLDYSNQNNLRTFNCNGGWGGFQDWYWVKG
ncbi:RICIN domain-containing protein [Nonomuraea sp. CA-141351]|uniref:RICIN domain-containing protein n=1 Tax=Nonomuraea sp. CA-141351 TaxID=3239996 RepID=UPI003D94E95C